MIDKEEYDKLLMKLGELAIRVNCLEKELDYVNSMNIYKKHLNGIVYKDKERNNATEVC